MFLITYKCMFIHGRLTLGPPKVGMFSLPILLNSPKVALVNRLKSESGPHEVQRAEKQLTKDISARLLIWSLLVWILLLSPRKIT